MSPEAKRIAIAELCRLRWGHSPEEDAEVLRVLPDINDLNVIRSVEVHVGLTDRCASVDLRVRWIQNLRNVIGHPCSDASVALASAAQRSEALLRTMGRWAE